MSDSMSRRRFVAMAPLPLVAAGASAPHRSGPQLSAEGREEILAALVPYSEAIVEAGRIMEKWAAMDNSESYSTDELCDYINRVKFPVLQRRCEQGRAFHAALEKHGFTGATLAGELFALPRADIGYVAALDDELDGDANELVAGTAIRMDRIVCLD